MVFASKGSEVVGRYDDFNALMINGGAHSLKTL